MTLQELKQKCKLDNWEIKKISESPARIYRVRYETPDGSRSHAYNNYVRRKCSTCKKEGPCGLLKEECKDGKRDIKNHDEMEIVNAIQEMVEEVK